MVNVVRVGIFLTDLPNDLVGLTGWVVPFSGSFLGVGKRGGAREEKGCVPVGGVAPVALVSTSISVGSVGAPRAAMGLSELDTAR